MVNSDNNIKTEETTIPTEVKTEARHHATKAEDTTFSDLYEQSLQEIPLGQVVTGTIVEINDDTVMIDVGYKTEGRLRTSELRNEDGSIEFSIGDEIEVFVDRKQEDELILSREKAMRMRVWKDIIKAYEQGATIQGKAVKKVKGGLSVDIGIWAFLPGSQIDVNPVRDFDRYLGKTFDFEVLKYDRKRNNVVLSRKSIIEREVSQKKQGLLETLSEGKVVEGVVKNITDYGIFIDLGGIDGLLHITDMSWGRIRHPSDNFSKGDKITVKILSFDKETEKVSLGLKQLNDNPWNSITERYPIGSSVEGKVVSFMDYGAFVELETGVEGLIHVSEMFWTKKIRHPSSVLTVGETVNVMILEVDSQNRRISLGFKQTMPNPWQVLAEKYPVGTIVKGKIKNITDFGMFVGIDEDIDGLVHVSDISWKKRIRHPSEFYKKGQEVEAVVLNVDVEHEKFSLGIKQLEKNPWDDLESRYSVGDAITGTVTNVTDFGLFVEIEEGLEGLVHVSELGQQKDKTFKEAYKVGDEVKAVVKNIDVKSQKVGLSIKGFEQSSESSTIKQYVNNKEKVVSNLGNILSGIKV
ncbi:MAG: 30S ribosomal protein S1 [Deltaproteobacteria bacterium]|nr:30S ribosomal protein S1 [Deltaproteobacteria bacterium]